MKHRRLRLPLRLPFPAVLCALLGSAFAADKPNVVLVITDDQGYYDIAAHGNEVIQTPALDKLWSESVRLTNFHVDPTCAPTRSALMTGRYSARVGVWHTIMGRSLMRRGEMTLAEVFEHSGYRTGMFGKWHLGDNYPYRPQHRGFDTAVYHGGGGVGQTPDYFGNDYFDDTYWHATRDKAGVPVKHKGYCTDVWFAECGKFIRAAAAEKKPFFAYLSTNAPHGPYLVADKYKKLYEGKVKGNKAAFYGMITNIDENLARLRRMLADEGLARDTIVIFMTDNGTSAGDPGDMRGRKGSEYEGGHRVPFFIHWPGHYEGGRDVPQLTAHLDVLPTLTEICGLTPPREVAIDGMSFKPLLDGEAADWPDRMLVVESQRIMYPEKWRKCSVMNDLGRLVNGKEFYTIRTDVSQKQDVADLHPEEVRQDARLLRGLLGRSGRHQPQGVQPHRHRQRHRESDRADLPRLADQGRPDSVEPGAHPRGQGGRGGLVGGGRGPRGRVRDRPQPLGAGSEGAAGRRHVRPDAGDAARGRRDPRGRRRRRAAGGVRGAAGQGGDRTRRRLCRRRRQAPRLLLRPGAPQVNLNQLFPSPMKPPLVLVAVLGALSALAAAAAERPNIVFIMADDLGYRELGCYGQKLIRTPHLDRLAAQGMKLTRHYSGSPVCAPSRCVLMTGKHPGHAFVRNNSEHKPEGQAAMPGDELTLADRLKPLGYTSGAFGKWGLGYPGSESDPLKAGFDRFFGYNCQRHAHSFYPSYLWDDDKRIALENDPPIPGHAKLPPDAPADQAASYERYKGTDYAADRIVDQVLAFIRDNREGPFFCYYPTLIPHLALHVPDESVAPYLEMGWEDPPDSARYTPHFTPRAAYAGMISRLDDNVGKVLALLDELKLSDNTIVVFTSDNGATYLGPMAEFFDSVGELRGLKGQSYEGGLRVPCIVRWPGRIEPGGGSGVLSGFEDWTPTLLSFVGAENAAAAGGDGVDIGPALLGEPQAPRDFLYREFAGYGGHQAVWQGKWKAIRVGLQKTVSPIELYDLEADPGESKDLAAAHPELVRKFAAIMEAEHQPSERFPLRALDR